MMQKRREIGSGAAGGKGETMKKIGTKLTVRRETLAPLNQVRGGIFPIDPVGQTNNTCTCTFTCAGCLSQ
jgi:hypothetical protein